MTKRKPSPKPKAKRVIGTPFPKGVSGNPLGGRLHNPDIRRIKRMTQTELALIGTMLLKENLPGIDEIAESDVEPSLKVWIAKAIRQGMRDRSIATLETILDRIVGRVADQVKFTEDKEKRIQELLIARGVLNGKRKG